MLRVQQGYQMGKRRHRDICDALKVKSTNVQFIDFSFNLLYEIKSKCFFFIKKVQLLLLNNNNLSMIKKQSFVGLNNLLKLDLSCN